MASVALPVPDTQTGPGNLRTWWKFTAIVFTVDVFNGGGFDVLADGGYKGTVSRGSKCVELFPEYLFNIDVGYGNGNICYCCFINPEILFLYETRRSICNNWRTCIIFGLVVAEELKCQSKRIGLETNKTKPISQEANNYCEVFLASPVPTTMTLTLYLLPHSGLWKRDINWVYLEDRWIVRGSARYFQQIPFEEHIFRQGLGCNRNLKWIQT